MLCLRVVRNVIAPPSLWCRSLSLQAWHVLLQPVAFLGRNVQQAKTSTSGAYHVMLMQSKKKRKGKGGHKAAASVLASGDGTEADNQVNVRT